MYKYHVYPDELYHHGVKGMKWGVRKEGYSLSSRVGNIAKYGWDQGHGKNVYARLQDVKSQKSIGGKTRYQQMSDRQRLSYKSATDYWKNRAEGKGYGESGNRNIVKRLYDDSRSISLGRRAAMTASSTAAQVVYNQITGMGQVQSGGQAARSIVSSTAGSLLVDELENRAFGHF